MIRTVKLGKLPRKFSPHVPHFRALAEQVVIPTPPPAVDNTKGISQFGVMLNDTLGDCTCAGIYHSKQIWSLNTSTEQTESDRCVMDLYENACGYRPADPSNTDNGGVLQNVLIYCTNTGILLNDGSREKFLGFVEVDVNNQNEVKVTISEFGLAYIGFNVPSNLFSSITGEPEKVWSDTSSNDIEGGHCVILVGYDANYLTVLSWGSLYKMTWAFLEKYCDEVYAVVSPDWIKVTGATPLGLTTEQLEALMAGIREN